MKISKLALIVFLSLHSAGNFAQADDAPASAPADSAPASAPAPEAPSGAPTATGSGPMTAEPKVTNVSLTSTKGALETPKINKSLASCGSAAKTAHTFCLSSNPKIQSASAMIGLLISGASALKSTSESCEKYNKAMKIAEMALTAYNTMCTATQMSCESSCGNNEAELEGEIKMLNVALTSDGLVSGQEALIKKDIATLEYAKNDVSNKLRVCQAYKINLAAAGVGLMNVVKQSSLQSQCQKQTAEVDCLKDPSNAACAKQVVDCTKPEYSSNTQCICMAAPNTPGCAGAATQMAITPQPRGTNTDPSASKSSSLGTPFGGGADSGITGTGGGSGAGAIGSTGAGAAGGGADSSLGGGGNNAAGAASADGKNSKATSTNILSGYEGGGGGGGRGGGGYTPDSAYKAYLPGGAKDPNRGIASKTFGNGEVTAAGSKSNWEKVSERYMDNKPTLMGP